MIALEVLWWAGWLYFLAWVALPLAGVPVVGPALGLAAWVLLAPWSSLLGMALLHRLLPRSEAGTYRMFADRGSVAWALKEWAPSIYLAVFQPVFFLSFGFQRAALWAFQARLGPGASLSSRTVVREPHHLRLGRASLVGEYAHLACSCRPRPNILIVGPIDIGDEVLVGAHSVVGPGVRIGRGSTLELAVRVGPGSTIGEHARVGAGASIYSGVRVGSNVRIGKGCIVPSGCVIEDGAVIPAGTVLKPGAAWPGSRRGA